MYSNKQLFATLKRMAKQASSGEHNLLPFLRQHAEQIAATFNLTASNLGLDALTALDDAEIAPRVLRTVAKYETARKRLDPNTNQDVLAAIDTLLQTANGKALGTLALQRLAKTATSAGSKGLVFVDCGNVLGRIRLDKLKAALKLLSLKCPTVELVETNYERFLRFRWNNGKGQLSLKLHAELNDSDVILHVQTAVANAA